MWQAMPLQLQAAIDGRNPIWEAPASQLSIFCNYSPFLHDARWLLLESRGKSICSNRIKGVSGTKELAVVGDLTSKKIFLFSYHKKQDLFNTVLGIIFKPLHHDVINTSSNSFATVSRNNQNMILSVPDYLDYPSVWTFNHNLRLKPTKDITYQIYTLSLDGK